MECKLPKESLSKLCYRAEIAFKQLQDIQHGGTPRTSTLQNMAKRLGVSVLWLQEGLGPKDPKELVKMINDWEAKQRKRAKALGHLQMGQAS